MKGLKILGGFILLILAFAGITQRNVPGGENNIYLGIVCLILAILLLFSLVRKKKFNSSQNTPYLPQHNITANLNGTTEPNSEYNENSFDIKEERIHNIRITSLFLRWCKNHTSVLPKEQYPAYMQYSWGIKNPVQFHTQLIQEGYLAEMNLEQKIRHLKVADLKNILKSLKLPVSGKKQELIDRILECDNLYQLDYTLKTQKEYCLSKKAISFLEKSNDIISLETERLNINSYTADGVEKYQILATLDNKTCDICGELDGKIFLVKDAIIGLNFPPFHQGCRCTTVAYYDDTPMDDLTRVARDADGQYIDVPADMTYLEWKKKYL